MKTLPPAPGLSLLLVSGLLPAFAGAQSGILVGSRVTAKLLGDIIGGSVGAAWKVKYHNQDSVVLVKE